MLNAPMNIRTLRMKNSKKAVTPVIATIILIAATIVLALVVGAYTFGLFGSNVKTVTLASATLYAGTNSTSRASNGGNLGTSYFVFALNNPGSSSTVTSVTMTGSGIASISSWVNSTKYTVFGTNAPAGAANDYTTLTGGIVSSYTLYPAFVSATTASNNILSGQLYNYVINFANGQSVSGVLTAQ